MGGAGALDKIGSFLTSRRKKQIASSWKRRERRERKKREKRAPVGKKGK